MYEYEGIQPIKERVHPAYEYEGVQDATRESPDWWTKEEMFDRLKSLFQNEGDIKTAPHIRGLHVNNPPDEVCSPSSNSALFIFLSETHSAYSFALNLLRLCLRLLPPIRPFLRKMKKSKQRS